MKRAIAVLLGADRTDTEPLAISELEKRLAEAERRVAVFARALRRIQGGRVLADEAREIWQEIAKDALDEAGVERQP